MAIVTYKGKEIAIHCSDLECYDEYGITCEYLDTNDPRDTSPTDLDYIGREARCYCIHCKSDPAFLHRAPRCSLFKKKLYPSGYEKFPTFKEYDGLCLFRFLGRDWDEERCKECIRAERK